MKILTKTLEKIRTLSNLRAVVLVLKSQGFGDQELKNIIDEILKEDADAHQDKNK